MAPHTSAQELPIRPVVVLLGASDYLYQPDLKGAPSFKKAASALRLYLSETLCPGEAGSSRILDLFDTDLDGPSIDIQLADFLDKQVAKAPVNKRPTDLLLFYIGHGGFRVGSTEYYLALRTTRKRNSYFHGLPLSLLAGTLSQCAGQLRRFIFIDACFAGAAAFNFQSPLSDVLKAKVNEIPWSEEAFPNAGTALLCASSKHAPAEFVNHAGTMFIDALMAALHTGDPRRGERLSIKDVHQQVSVLIRQKYGEHGVMPELHLPDQRKGTIESFPLFDNVARSRPLEIVLPRPRGVADVALQTRLGNPTNAVDDAANQRNRLIQRPQWAASYNSELGRPNWVAWELHRSDLGPAPRPQRFLADPMTPGGQRPILPADYTGSGFDRGHLCPPSDRRACDVDAESTMYMTNVVPQSQRYNQQAWANFEEYCRTLCKRGFVLYNIAGTDGDVERIGGKIAVPALLWRVVVAVPETADSSPPLIDGETRVIAVRMLNNDARLRHADWRVFITSVAMLENELAIENGKNEALTLYHFFEGLEPKLAEAFKSRIDSASE